MNQRIKPLLELHGATLLEHVIALARPQVDHLVLNVNQQEERFTHLDLAIVRDNMAEQGGPLLGIAAAMTWYLTTQENADSALLTIDDSLACFAADVPRFPNKLVQSLQTHMLEADAEVALCRTGEQLQPLFSLWSCHTGSRLNELVASGFFGPKQIYRQFRHVIVDIELRHPGDFLNINTPEDLQQAKRVIPA